MKKNYFTRIFAIVLVVMSVLTVTLTASATAETMWVNDVAVALRNGASTSATIRDRMAKGLPVTVLQKNIVVDGVAWARVKYNNRTGYAMQSFLTSTDSGITHPQNYRQAFGHSTIISDSGMVSFFVRNVQMCLNQGGYYTGEINGRYTAATITAVKAFQSSHNLASDGKVGTNTMQALWASYHNLMMSSGSIQP